MPSFEWDPAKAVSNRKKHSGVTFEDAIHVFGDDHAIDAVAPDPDEDRRKIIGMATDGRILVVVYMRAGRRLYPDHIGQKGHQV